MNLEASTMVVEATMVAAGGSNGGRTEATTVSVGATTVGVICMGAATVVVGATTLGVEATTVGVAAATMGLADWRQQQSTTMGAEATMHVLKVEATMGAG